MKMTIRHQIIMFIILITVFFTLIFLGILYRDFIGFDSDQFIEETVADTQERLELVEDEMTARTQHADQLVLAIERYILTGASMNQRRLQEWVGGNAFLKSMVYIEEDGIIHASFLLEDEPRLGPSQWYLGAMGSDGIHHTLPYIHQFTGEQVITFSKAIYEGETFLGVVGLDFDIDYLFREITELNQENVSGYMLFSRGEMVKSNLSAEEIVLAKEVSDDYIDEIKGYVYDMSFDSMDYDLKLLLQQPRILIMNRTYWLQILLAVLVYILLLVMMMRTVVVELVTPFNHLKLAVLSIRRGRYEETPQPLDQGDFDSVYKGFVSLGQYLKRNIIQLDRLKVSLNSKYEELDFKRDELEAQYDLMDESRRNIQSQLESYEEIVNMMSDMIWEIDDSGKITRINKSFLSHLGYSEDQMIGVSFYTIIENYLSEAALLDLILKKDHEDMMLVFITSDNRHKSFKTKFMRLLDSEGKVARIQALSINESDYERKFVELETRSRELVILGELSQEIMIHQTIDDIIRSFVARLKVLLPLEAMTVRLIQDDRLKGINILDPKEDFVMMEHLQIETSNAGLALKSGKLTVMAHPEDMLYPDEFLEDYLRRGGQLIFVPLKGESGPIGVISLATFEPLSEVKLNLIESMAIKVSMAVNNRLIFEKLGKNYLNTVNTLNAIIRAKSEAFYIKSRFIAALARHIGQSIYLKEQEILDLGITGLINDIGIIGIPDELIEMDRQMMSFGQREEYDRHAELGYEIISPLGYDQKILNSVRYHHQICLTDHCQNLLFEKIICFSNWLEESLHESDCADIPSLVKRLYELDKELHCNTCREFLHLIRKEIKEGSENLETLFTDLKRGGLS